MPRGKTPKLKALNPRINILGPKNLCLLALALSVARKVTELQTAGKKVNCSLCLCLQAKTALKMKNQFPNRETELCKRVFVVAKLVLVWHVQLTPTVLLLRLLSYSSFAAIHAAAPLMQSALMLQPERAVPEQLAPARAPNTPSTT